MHLVIVGGLEKTIAEALKVLKVDREVGICDNTLQYALKMLGCGS